MKTFTVRIPLIFIISLLFVTSNSMALVISAPTSSTNPLSGVTAPCNPLDGVALTIESYSNNDNTDPNDDTGYLGTGFGSVTLNGIYNVNDDASNNLIQEKEYDSMGFLGTFTDPKNDKPLPNGTNIGENDSGYLNGEPYIINSGSSEKNYSGTNLFGQSFNNYDITGNEFAETHDLLNDGNRSGPGWIYLGKDGPNGESETTTVGSGLLDTPITVSDVIGLNVDAEKGRWSVTQHADTFDEVSKLLGNNYFDQLALVLKTGTSWAVYQIDFKQIFEIEAYRHDNVLNFQPYTLTGTFNTSDIGNKDISHISFWAHDPPGGTPVPEPSTLILLGSGLLGLGVCARRRKK